MSPAASSSSALETAPSARSASPYDDDDDDISCPLCLDEMDVSDLSFKPCPCGYQICRFCWHHLKETLGQPCPNCRQPYDDDSVQFTPMKPEEIKHIQNVRKQKEREKKDSQVNTRRHLANVRVKQKAQVHVQGLTSKTANEENLAGLKSAEQFGQFGRVSKIFLSRRPPPPAATSAAGVAVAAAAASTSHYPVHVYISYLRPQDASACIAAMNGSLSPEGTRLRVSWGTTKYCSTFLKGQRCLNDNCMGAHELGEEIETSSAMSSTREAISDLKSAFKDNESRKSPHPSNQHALPPSASWAAKGSSSSTSSPSSTSTSLPVSRPARPSPSSTSSRFPKLASHPLPPRPAAATHIRHTSSTHSSSTATSVKPRRTSSSAGSTADNNSNSNSNSNNSSTNVPPPRSSSPLPSSSSTTPAVSSSHSPHSSPVAAPSSATTTHPSSSYPPTSSDITPSIKPPTNLVTSPPPGLVPPQPQPSQQQQQQSSSAGTLNPHPPRRPSQPVPTAATSPFADFDLALGTFDDGASFSFSLDLNAKGKQRSFENNNQHITPTIDNPAGTHPAHLHANGPPGLQFKNPTAAVAAADLSLSSASPTFDRFPSSDLSAGHPPSRYYAGPFNPFESSLPSLPNDNNINNNGNMGNGNVNSSSSDSGFTSPTTPFAAINDDTFSRKSSRFEFARTNGGNSQYQQLQHPQFNNTMQYGLRRDDRFNSNPPPPIGDARLSSPITPAMMTSNSHLSALSDEPSSAADIPLGQARATNSRNSNNLGSTGLLDGTSPWSGINLDDSYSTNALPAELTRNLVLSPEILASLPPLPPPTPSTSTHQQQPQPPPPPQQQHQPQQSQLQPLPDSSSASSSFSINKDIPTGLYPQSLHTLPPPHPPHPSQQQQQQPRRSFVHEDHNPYGNAMNMGHDTRQSYGHASPFANDNAATFQDPAILNMRLSPVSTATANPGYVGAANHNMNLLGMGMPAALQGAGMHPPHPHASPHSLAAQHHPGASHPQHPPHPAAAYQSLDSSSVALMAEHRKASVGGPTAIKARDR